MNRKLVATLLATMLVLTAFAPAAVSAQESTQTTDLTVSLTQDPETGIATVTATDDAGPVTDATANVTSSVTYGSEGQYTTDANGTFELPNPARTVEIDVAVTSNGTEVTETFTLVPVEESIDVAITQNGDGTTLVEVTQYGTALGGAEVELSSTVAYAGNGTYTTDANGTVDLPEPEQTAELTAVVTAGDLEAIETATIEPIAEFEVGLAASDDGTATVTVTRDDDPVENATVTVTSDGAYAGNGTYATDANGTVDLPEPERTIAVTITAEDGEDEATTDADLSPVDTGLAVDVVQNGDGTAAVTVTDDGSAVENATVNVTSDVAYDGNGTYTTGAEGAVELPRPDENVTITVIAINGSEEATATAELEIVENGGFANFGQWVSSYVHQLRDEGYFGAEFGQKVSEFATENNPGADERPDHAGPNEQADDEGTESSDEADGAAESAPEDDDRGPPAHAQNERSDTTTADETEADAGGAGEAGDDCDAEDSAETCDSEDDEAERDGEAESEDDGDGAPGNSGDKGNSEGSNGNNGNGNGRGK
ncbi:hypothetical protein [Salinigranum marinum]|uniref:hypothetical protein n=1 Tax=Salinigranum marinum TaxID=1515595 RepID=UPI002989FFD1|nr:hypothetical protein [Salinigranum marinum]